MARSAAKPILDVRTGEEYRSESAAGRELAPAFGLDPNDNWVFFRIWREAPDRFKTRNARGEWVPLDHPTAPRGTTLPNATVVAEEERRTRVTSVELDEGKLARVRSLLGTATLRETIDRAFDDVLARDARRRAVQRLQRMEGLDLDKPAVMKDAWR